MEQTTNYQRQKLIFSILAVLVFCWAVSGALDIANIPYNGVVSSPDNVVIAAREGSPATQAGLQVGDTITKIDNIPIEDFAAFTNRARPAIGSDGSVTRCSPQPSKDRGRIPICSPCRFRAATSSTE